MTTNFRLSWLDKDGSIRVLEIHEDDIRFHLDRLQQAGHHLLSLRREGF